MLYSPVPPSELLRTGTIAFPPMQALRRVARYWDLFHNSGRFPAAMGLLLDGASPFACFFAFAQWLHAQLGRTHGVALNRQFELLATYLRDVRGLDASAVRAAVVADYQRAGKKDELPWLFEAVGDAQTKSSRGRANRRQARRLSPPTTE